MCWISQSYNFDIEKVSWLYGESICVWILCGAVILRFLMHSNSQNVNADSVIGEWKNNVKKNRKGRTRRIQRNETKQTWKMKWYLTGLCASPSGWSELFHVYRPWRIHWWWQTDRSDVIRESDFRIEPNQADIICTIRILLIIAFVRYFLFNAQHQNGIGTSIPLAINLLC